MKRNPFFLLRMATLLTTAVINLVVADPKGFVGKAAERIRLADGPVSRIPTGWLRRFAAGQNTKARQLIDAGHLTEGVREVLKQGAKARASDIHLAKRTVEKIQQLEQHPYPGVPVTPQPAGARVLHVLMNSKPYTNSGYTVRSQHVLDCQQKAGIDAKAVTRLGYPVLVGKLPRRVEHTVNGVTYQHLLPWIYPRSLVTRDDKAVGLIVQAAREMQATALQTTTDYTNALVVSAAARVLGLPWVYEVRGELESTWLSHRPIKEQEAAELSEFYRLARIQENRCMRAASAVVALSEVSKQQMIDRGVAAEKITIIPNAVDADLIGREFNQREIRQELGLPIDKILFGSVTAVVEYEGLDTLIATLPLLPDDWEALIVGDGMALPGLKAQAEALGVADRSHFVGRKPSDDIWKWYAALDVFVVPRRDTKVTRTVTPIKPLIALALGIPVACSDLPALREITAGKAKYFESDNVSELAAVVEKLAGVDQNLFDFVRKKTWQKNGQKYAKIFSIQAE